MTDLDTAARDVIGAVVRQAWVRWARTQPNPKPSWLTPYGELDESDKEADRQIGEAVAAFVLGRDDAQAEIELLLTVEAIYWRALTDLLIGAQQQSQSHADVIALVARALREAGAVLPSDERRAFPATEDNA